MAALELLTGEWREVGGGGFEVAPLDRDSADSEPDADLLVFAPIRLGQLCDAGRLRPIRESTLRSEDLAWEDIHPAVRDKLLAFGGRSMALPIGCVAPLALSESEQPPAWTQIGPGGDLRPAWRLLARAAPIAAHELRESVLFDPESMTPALTQPALVEALTRLVAASESDGPATLVLPRRTSAGDSDPAVAHPYPLPGAERYFHPIRGEWLSAAGRQASLLGVDGRLVGVTTGSRNAAAAFRLAAWLAGKGNARQLATASDHVGNVRRSGARRPDDWTGRGDAGAGREFAAALDASWGAELQLVVPRIIDAEAYLAALDRAVIAAESGQAPPAEALAGAAAEWQELTERVGRDRQRQCYLRSLGVLQYTPEKR